jgi:hypothetical protein
MQSHNRVDNSQPQTIAWIRRCIPAPMKTLEKMMQIIWRDAGRRVCKYDPGFVLIITYA